VDEVDAQQDCKQGGEDNPESRQHWRSAMDAAVVERMGHGAA